MSSLALTWPSLCANARRFHLNEERFGALEPFFNTLHPGELEQYAAALPMSQAMKDALLMTRPAGRGFEQMLLLCIVANADTLEEHYRSQGLPMENCMEIFNDLNIWTSTLLRDIGGYGLTWRIYTWEAECLTGGVKAFGRLQCNDIHLFAIKKSFYRQADGSLRVLPAFTRGNPPRPDLTYGDPCINLHIPASGPLLKAECEASLQRMADFSRVYHPDYAPKAFVCYSWLLDPVFQRLLPPTSNIVQFQGLGHLFPLPENDQTNEVIWRIWGTAGMGIPYAALPRRNTLERSVADYLSAGGKFCEGLMIRFL